MKSISIHQKLEEVARKHLGLTTLNRLHQGDTYIVSAHQIEKALKAALMMGEQSGYMNGYKDATSICKKLNVSVDEIENLNKLSKNSIDRNLQFV